MTLVTTAQFGGEYFADNIDTLPRTKRLAQFYFASFWCILFTGAIRKWLFPHVTVFYLLQDVPIVLCYLYALVTLRFTRGYLCFGIIVLSVLITLQGLLQIIELGISPVIVAIGLHHYLLYLPMLLTFPLGLTFKYRREFIKWNLLLALPMSLLALAQAVSSTSAWVNKTSEGETMGLPGVDVPRVTGTFNFGVFFGIWIGMALALCLGEWLLPAERRIFKSRSLLILSTFSLVLTCLISGSRQNLLLAALAVVGAMIAAILIRSTRVIAVIAGILLSLPLAAALTFVISPTEFQVMHERLTGKSGSANLKDRTFGTLYQWLTEPEFSLIGRGVGLGVDAAHVGSDNAYLYTYDLSEGDTIRNVMELGTPVGILYVVARFSLMIGFIFLAIRLVHYSPHVLPLSLLMFGQAAADLTRAATMTSTQVMIGYAFILGVYFYPQIEEMNVTELDLSERTAAV
jgi:hypothetical protein